MKKLAESFRMGLTVALAIWVVTTFFGGTPARGEDVFPTPAGVAQGNAGVLPAPTGESEHVYLSGRNLGACGMLRGNIQMLIVFLDEEDAVWTDRERDSFMDRAACAQRLLEEDAASYGADLTLSMSYFTVSIPRDRENDWYDYVMTDYFYNEGRGMDHLQNYYQESLGYDDTPIIFAYNKEGRAYTYDCSASWPEIDEYSVYFNQTMLKDGGNIIHEFLHLYGAVDLYFPELTKNMAEMYFPFSVMLGGGMEIDELTAYLIGWTDYLTGEAPAFMQDVSSVTQEMIDQALNEEWERWGNDHF